MEILFLPTHYLRNDGVFPSSFQTGYTARHSTKQTFVKLTNDQLPSADMGNCSTSSLLHLNTFLVQFEFCILSILLGKMDRT